LSVLLLLLLCISPQQAPQFSDVLMARKNVQFASEPRQAAPVPQGQRSSKTRTSSQ
jgi:hypothetical protein